MSDSLGPCTSICDAASTGDRESLRSGCFTPWCECDCHVRARHARTGPAHDGSEEADHA